MTSRCSAVADGRERSCMQLKSENLRIWTAIEGNDVR
jgi:hypothetical protein